jgi:hypothetical protein
MEMVMKIPFVVAAIASLFGLAAATAAELPTFELTGFPITQHQVAVMGAANVQEQSPSPSLMQNGMPASPHQVAVLTPRKEMIAKETSTEPTTVGMSSP